MMRVAYVSADPGVPVFGSKGCSVHVMEILRAFRRTGADVEVFAARTGGVPPADLADVAVNRVVIDCARDADAAQRERAALAANVALAACLEPPRAFDLVYERHSLWSYGAMEAAARRGIPSVLEVNAPLIDEQARYRRLADRAAAERAVSRAFAAAGTIVAVSAEVARHVEGFPGTEGRVHVIPNGVDPRRFRVPAVPRTGFTVGFVGTLKAWHGLPVLAEAFTRLHRTSPDVRLLVVGDGPERARLVEALARGGALDAATLTGSVSPDVVPGLLARMDAGVAPYPDSHDFYFSPLKVLEYLAAGTPVVASAVGQLKSIIQHGENGLLCAPGDVGGFVQALRTLRDDPALRARLGAEGRVTAASGHDWSSVLRRILETARAGRLPAAPAVGAAT